MNELKLNNTLATLLTGHGININHAEEFIETDLPGSIKFKARSVYTEFGNAINSQMDVMVVTGRGEKIVESFGDLGNSVEEAITNNFQSFCSGSLHPLLAVLDCFDPHSYEQITLEEWEINGKRWKVYIGNIVPKVMTKQHFRVAVPNEFFDSIETAIKSQKLTNRIHWFRGYYSQIENQITQKEFLMDNALLENADKIFQNLPVIPGMDFFSSRIFICMRDALDM